MAHDYFNSRFDLKLRGEGFFREKKLDSAPRLMLNKMFVGVTVCGGVLYYKKEQNKKT